MNHCPCTSLIVDNLFFYASKVELLDFCIIPQTIILLQ
jgi:hypothetical protein